MSSTADEKFVLSKAREVDTPTSVRATKFSPPFHYIHFRAFACRAGVETGKRLIINEKKNTIGAFSLTENYFHIREIVTGPMYHHEGF